VICEYIGAASNLLKHSLFPKLTKRNN
jgi:hypothetical protein